MGERTICVDGERVTSPWVKLALSQLRPEKKDFLLPELADIRAKELDQSGDGKVTTADYFVDGKKEPRDVWKIKRIALRDFQSLSSYVDQILSPPAQAKVIKKIEFTDSEQVGTFFIAFAKDFADAQSLDDLEKKGDEKKKKPEAVSPYLVRVIFFKEGSATVQLIDRRAEEGQVYPARSKVFRIKKEDLDRHQLNFNLSKGEVLTDLLKNYLWQTVTREGDFKDKSK